MSQDDMPRFPLPVFGRREPRADAVHEFDSRRYYLLQLERHVLYCAEDANGTLSRLLFVPSETLVPVKLAIGTWKLSSENLEWYGRPPFVYPEDLFRAQVRNGQSGRFMIHASPLARDSAAALLFRPNGTGIFCDCYSQGYEQDAHSTGIYQSSVRKADAEGRLEDWQMIEFTWDSSRYGLAAPAEVLTCAEETLHPLCEEVFLAQVWPRMQEPFTGYGKFPDEALYFVRGSRETLERVTRSICHLDEKLFTGPSARNMEVRYYAQTSRSGGGFSQDEPDYASAWYEGGSALWFSRRSEQLIQLAFRHNTFRGAKWENIPGRRRRRDIQLASEQIIVSVPPPTAHERAEALLTLHEWLKGKVTEQERRDLLQVNAT